MGIKFTNSAKSTLLYAIGTGAASFTTAAGGGSKFPALGGGDYFFCHLVRVSDGAKEIVKVTARAGDVHTMTRAQEGTSALAFSVGDKVELRLTNQGIIDAWQAFMPDVASVASAATTAIGAACATNIGHVEITGTTAITAFDASLAGVVRFVEFDGVLTLTHNGVSLILPGAANITTAAGDVAIFRSLGGGNWQAVTYLTAAGGYAPAAGNAAQTFAVADATAANEAVNFSQVLGLGQTWQDMTASRAWGVVYTNSTGKPIAVAIQTASAVGHNFEVYVDGVLCGNIGSASGTGGLYAVVPDGSTYNAVIAAGVPSAMTWSELR